MATKGTGSGFPRGRFTYLNTGPSALLAEAAGQSPSACWDMGDLRNGFHFFRTSNANLVTKEKAESTPVAIPTLLWGIFLAVRMRGGFCRLGKKTHKYGGNGRKHAGVSSELMLLCIPDRQRQSALSCPGRLVPWVPLSPGWVLRPLCSAAVLGSRDAGEQHDALALLLYPPACQFELVFSLYCHSGCR